MSNLIYPVILAGGSGTRLWPRSREKSPKQFIPLIDGKSLFQETCLRFSDRKMFAFPTIITHEEHRFLVRDQLQKIGITDAKIITEPVAKNTLAACLSASNFLKNTHGNVPILFTPADHIVSNEIYLHKALINALPFVKEDAICIFGIKPSSPHTGYGYIAKGRAISEGIYKPSIFIEKPEKEKAIELMKNGALWNSGLYFCTPETLEQEAIKYTPELQKTLQDHFLTIKENSHGFNTISKEIYNPITPISIDKGITEYSDKIIIAELAIEWNDLGSWKSLYEHFDKNNHGNVVRGDTLALETKNSYIESTSRLVTVLGVEDIGVIETADAVLVFNLKKSESIKKIVETLNETKRTELDVHTIVQKPWGEYEVLGDENHYKAKKLTVYPGSGGLSIQRHKRRAEHWIVVSGTATVTLDDKVFILQKNESIFIPMGSLHRLQNNHSEVLQLIEVQTGDYFGEDDIERFGDTYGRA